MKKLWVVLICSFVLVLSVSYAADSKKGTKENNTRPSRPILPPIVPSTSSAVSQTPHISAPPTTDVSIELQPVANEVPAHIPMGHSIPAYATVPTGQVQAVFPQGPVISSIIGIVLDIKVENDGTRLLKVKDYLSDKALDIIVINMDNTHVIKNAVIVKFEEIKIGDTVNVVFNSAGENNTANFISILTKEQVDMWKVKLHQPLE